MSLIDSTFGGLSTRLISRWGQPVSLIRYADTGVYDPVTSTVTRMEDRQDTTAVVTTVKLTEAQVLKQEADIKILVNPQKLPDGYLFGADDEVELPSLVGSTQMTKAKVVDLRVVRGETGLLWILYARYQ